LHSLGARVRTSVGGRGFSSANEWGGEHEVDLIVERGDGRVLEVEFKLARDVGTDDVRQLNWLSEQLGDSLLDVVILTTGGEAYRRPDGVAVIPAVLLGV